METKDQPTKVKKTTRKKATTQKTSIPMEKTTEVIDASLIYIERVDTAQPIKNPTMENERGAKKW